MCNQTATDEIQKATSANDRQLIAFIQPQMREKKQALHQAGRSGGAW